MWPLAGVVYLSAIVVLVYLLAAAQHFAGRFFVYEPLVGMPAFFVAVFQTEALAG